MELLREVWVGTIVSAGAGLLAGLGEIFKVIIIYIVARLAIFGAIDGALAPVIERQSKGENGARVRTLKSLLKSVIGYVLFFVAAVMTLRAFGVDPIPVLATVSVAGLAVGFGAQRLVRDVISGFFILLENQYAVGEYITVGTVTGTVEEVGMRVTRIRDDAGKLNIIANGDITNVCNYSRGSVNVSVDISVAASVDPDRVVELLNDAGEHLRHERTDIFTPPRYTGLVAMDSIRLTLRFTGACHASDIERVQMAVRERFREILKASDIPVV